MMHLVDVSGVSLDCDGENRCDGDDHDDDSGAGSVACSAEGVVLRSMLAVVMGEELS